MIRLRDSQNSETPLYSWLQFMAVNRHRLRSAKRKGTWGSIQESSTHRASACSPSVQSRTAGTLLAATSDSVHVVLPANSGSSPEPWCLESSLGLSHVDRAVHPRGGLGLQPLQKPAETTLLLYGFPRAPVTKYHRAGDLSNRKVFCPRSRG